MPKWRCKSAKVALWLIDKPGWGPGVHSTDYIDSSCSTPAASALFHCSHRLQLLDCVCQGGGLVAHQLLPCLLPALHSRHSGSSRHGRHCVVSAAALHPRRRLPPRSAAGAGGTAPGACRRALLVPTQAEVPSQVLPRWRCHPPAHPPTHLVEPKLRQPGDPQVCCQPLDGILCGVKGGHSHPRVLGLQGRQAAGSRRQGGGSWGQSVCMAVCVAVPVFSDNVAQAAAAGMPCSALRCMEHRLTPPFVSAPAPTGSAALGAHLQLVHQRRDHFALVAPGRPKLDHHLLACRWRGAQAMAGGAQVVGIRMARHAVVMSAAVVMTMKFSDT